MLDETIPETCLVDAAVPNSHILHCGITEKQQKVTDWEEGFIGQGD